MSDIMRQRAIVDSDLAAAVLFNEDDQYAFSSEGARNLSLQLLRPLVLYKMALERSRPTVDRIITGMIVELFGVFAPDTMRLSVPAAQERVIQVALWLTRLESVEYTNIPMNKVAKILRREGINGAINVPDDGRQFTFQDATRVLIRISAYLNKQVVIGPLTLLANMVVGHYNRGQISEGVGHMIIQRITDHFGIRVRISPDVVHDYWNITSGWFVGLNESEYFERLFVLFPQPISLRLSLTIQQTIGGGLTAFRTIGYAIRNHVGFDWASVIQMFPDDFYNFLLAINAVNGDVHYGFRQDMVVAESSQFRSLAWVANEIMARVDGRLATNSDWERGIHRQADITILIDDYIIQRNIVPNLNKVILAKTEGLWNGVRHQRYNNLFNL